MKPGSVRAFLYSKPENAAHPRLLSQRVDQHLARLKAELLEQMQAATTIDAHWLRLALNEAEALAWESGYPQLFFRSLAEEKLRALHDWYARQLVVRKRRVFSQKAA